MKNKIDYLDKDDRRRLARLMTLASEIEVALTDLRIAIMDFSVGVHEKRSKPKFIRKR